MSAPFTFTVFTPTFQRAHTLTRVYDSLVAQTLRDFEWLIVDDGSTDATAELVRRWQKEAAFSVRYFEQPNMGKHHAHNRAVTEARGELFLTLDSDDACVPTALERFKYHWDALGHARDRYSAVTALCCDQLGRVIGERFPRDPLDSNSLEMLYRYRVTGEKWGFQRTDILRRFPFPTQHERTYMPEALVWGAIARHYVTRYINEPLRIYIEEGPSLSRALPPARHAIGLHTYSAVALNEHLDYLWDAPAEFLKRAGQYARMAFHRGIGLRAQWSGLRAPVARVLWLLMLPPAAALYVRDRIVLRLKPRPG